MDRSHGTHQSSQITGVRVRNERRHRTAFDAAGEISDRAGDKFVLPFGHLMGTKNEPVEGTKDTVAVGWSRVRVDRPETGAQDVGDIRGADRPGLLAVGMIPRADIALLSRMPPRALGPRTLQRNDH